MVGLLGYLMVGIFALILAPVWIPLLILTVIGKLIVDFTEDVLFEIWRRKK